MNVRKITLGSAAIAAALFCALPASAQSRYTRDSTPEERAQTEALNSRAADRAQGNFAADAAARNTYNANEAAYRDGMADHAARQDAYNRDMARYNNRYSRYSRYNRYNHYNRHGSNAVISVNFGDIAFGYSDGYWDNSHRWHAWRNDAEARSYRDHSGSNFHSWRHDHDRNSGWQR